VARCSVQESGRKVADGPDSHGQTEHRRMGSEVLRQVVPGRRSAVAVGEIGHRLISVSCVFVPIDTSIIPSGNYWSRGISGIFSGHPIPLGVQAGQGQHVLVLVADVHELPHQCRAIGLGGQPDHVAPVHHLGLQGFDLIQQALAVIHRLVSRFVSSVLPLDTSIIP
jgi:hypothetical protein